MTQRLVFMDTLQQLYDFAAKCYDAAAAGDIDATPPHQSVMTTAAQVLAATAIPHVRCSDCGSANVQTADSWLNPNTDEYSGDTEQSFGELYDKGLSWCEDCNECTELYLCDETGAEQ